MDEWLVPNICLLAYKTNMVSGTEMTLIRCQSYFYGDSNYQAGRQWDANGEDQPLWANKVPKDEMEKGQPRICITAFKVFWEVDKTYPA